MAELNEFALIHKLTNQKQSKKFLDQHGVAVGIGDDAAVVNCPPRTQLVTSCDTMVEEIHFNQWTMLDEDVGYKAMAVNVSDIVAMGAKPKHALISISIPKTYSEERVERIYKGLYACAEQYEIAVIGGDTTSSPRHASISVTLLGEIEAGQALLRSAAQPGDVVFVTGFPGCSAAGLHYLQQQKVSGLPLEDVPEPLRDLVQAHRQPKPSVEAGRLLRTSGCHALNDISDGLASEAWEIAEASEVEIVIDQSRIPIAPQLAAYAKQQSELLANTQQQIGSTNVYRADDVRQIDTVDGSQADDGQHGDVTPKVQVGDNRNDADSELRANDDPRNDVASGLRTNGDRQNEAVSGLRANDGRENDDTGEMLTDGDGWIDVALEWALNGGEDFCLLGTAAKASMSSIEQRFQQAGLPIFAIGEVTAKGQSGVYLLNSTEAGTHKAQALPKSGYEHFK